MGVEANITDGLLNYLLDLNILPVAMPNVPYPAVGEEKVLPYLEPHVLKAPTAGVGLIGEGNQHSGFLQVNVVHLVDEGLVPAEQIADEIIEAFPRNSHIEHNGVMIRFTEPGYSGSQRNHEDGKFIPVTIPYLVLA